MRSVRELTHLDARCAAEITRWQTFSMPTVRNAEYELVARPYKTTIGCWIAAIAVLGASIVAAAAMGELTEAGGVFHGADQYTMVGLGIIGGLAALSMTRPAVWVGEAGIKIRNVASSYTLEWELVESVDFPRDASWGMVKLPDGDVISILAIQSVDGQRAVDAMRKLRAAVAKYKG